MNETRNVTRWLLPAGFVMLAIALTVLLMPGRAADSTPHAHEADAVGQVVLAEGSELLQSLTYTRCEHAVTRRLTAPVELYGKNLEQVAALYPEWRITEFAANCVTMEQQPDLFCPDHLVVMADGTGAVCVFENKYGDALMMVRQLDLALASLPAAVQEEVQHGIGFSTAEELEMWLENAES